MIWRTLATCSALDFASLPLPIHREFFEPDADVAAKRDGLRGDRQLRPAGAEHRPVIVVPEQPVGGALHMRDVLGMGADAAEDAEHALHEERRLDQAAIGEMGKRVEMADVVALDLEARAVFRAGRKDVFDVAERVAEDAVARAFEIGLFPFLLEVLKRSSMG